MVQSGCWKYKVLALMALLVLAPVNAVERGPIPIACFSQNTGGGTAPVTVTFNPSCTYLPVPTSLNQTFFYRVVWDFGDGTTPSTVPANGSGSITSALAPIAHVFTGARITYTVTMRVDVIIASADGSFSAGPSSQMTSQVQLANANVAPDPGMLNLSPSPSNGALPYTVTIQPNVSDPDGFILYALLDWGDGTTTRISPIPANVNDPPFTVQHTYITPGNFSIRLFEIDNGRLLAGIILPSTVANTVDPLQALAEITAFNTANSGFLAVEYQPVLKQDSIFVQVLGNMQVLKGKFNLKFNTVGKDKFNVSLKTVLFAESAANANVSLRLGSGTRLTVNGVSTIVNPAFSIDFTTDAKARFKDSALGFVFDYNGRKQRLTIKLTNATLTKAFGIADTNVINGFADVPIIATINQTVLATTARFVLNSTMLKGATGKKARTFPLGK